MAEITKIQWTRSTFNPWRGCTKVSPGCAHCYAETGSKRNPKVLGVWGPNGTRVLASEAKWREPLRWNEMPQLEGEGHKVFCASLADVFEHWEGQMTDSAGYPLCYYPYDPGRHAVMGTLHDRALQPYTLDVARDRLFRLIEATPRLQWQLLTKRPENMVPMASASLWVHHWPDHVWAMTSVEDQATADARIPELLRVPARVRGLSVEPLLGPVDLRSYLAHALPLHDTVFGGGKLHWVIIGGESGPHARPCHVEWVRDLVRQCQDAGVACFVKQLGTVPAFDGSPASHGLDTARQFKAQPHPHHGWALRLGDPKGGNPDEWPEDLRAREFPVIQEVLQVKQVEEI